MKKLDEVSVTNVVMQDYPDFSDAYIDYATWDDGTELTEDELEELNEDTDFVHELAHNQAF